MRKTADISRRFWYKFPILYSTEIFLTNPYKTNILIIASQRPCRIPQGGIQGRFLLPAALWEAV